MTDVGAGRAPDADDDTLTLDGPLGELVAALRAPADLGADVNAAVMAAVRLAPPLTVVEGGAATAPRPVVAPAAARRPNVFVRGARWITRPRPVRVSPLGALMAAGLAFAAVFGLRREAQRSAQQVARTGEFAVPTGEYPVAPAAAAPSAVASSAPAAPAAQHDTVFVTRFMLVAPGAKNVALVGDFNAWDHDATPLVQVKGGVWTVELPLNAGQRYAYAFVVDGHRWVSDPAAPRAVGDDFGRPSSVVTVRGA